MILALLAVAAMQSPPLCDAANNWCGISSKAITIPLRPCPRSDVDGMPLLSNGRDPTTAVSLITAPVFATYVVHVKRLLPSKCAVFCNIFDSPANIYRVSVIVAGDMIYRMEADDGTLTCKSGAVVSVVRKP